MRTRPGSTPSAFAQPFSTSAARALPRRRAGRHHHLAARRATVASPVAIAPAPAMPSRSSNSGPPLVDSPVSQRGFPGIHSGGAPFPEKGSPSMSFDQGREVVIVEAVRTPIGRGHPREGLLQGHAPQRAARPHLHGGHRPRGHPRRRGRGRHRRLRPADRRADRSTSGATPGCRPACRSRRPRRPSTASAARPSRPSTSAPRSSPPASTTSSSAPASSTWATSRWASASRRGHRSARPRRPSCWSATSSSRRASRPR